MRTVPSQMSMRRIPEGLHLQVRIAYASAWEALIETHISQALQFLCEFAPRIPVLEGMDLYFQVTQVPEAMQEVVRSRTLTTLDLETLAPVTKLPELRGWQRLRLDLVIEYRSYRRRYYEKTIELARIVGARASEAVVQTHVENAIGFAGLLKGVLAVGAATDHYLREFGLSSTMAQMVAQRVQARVAGQVLTEHHDEPMRPRFEPSVPEVEPVLLPEPAAVLPEPADRPGVPAAQT
jgi:hypothetical protein